MQLHEGFFSNISATPNPLRRAPSWNACCLGKTSEKSVF